MSRNLKDELAAIDREITRLQAEIERYEANLRPGQRRSQARAILRQAKVNRATVNKTLASEKLQEKIEADNRRADKQRNTADTRFSVGTRTPGQRAVHDALNHSTFREIEPQRPPKPAARVYRSDETVDNRVLLGGPRNEEPTHMLLRAFRDGEWLILQYYPPRPEHPDTAKLMGRTEPRMTVSNGFQLQQGRSIPELIDLLRKYGLKD